MIILQKKFAFTLAEVLITLGIIGIVAAMTIPSLIASYQKTLYVAGLKKAYAEVTEALKLMANDSGCPDNLKCIGVFGKDNEALGTEFKKYLKVAKDCGIATDPDNFTSDCWSNDFSYFYDDIWGRTQWNWYGEGGDYFFTTADGYSIALHNHGQNCNFNEDTSITNANINQLCAELYIDVNGTKGPNNMGRDIFDFWITNGKGPALYPQSGSEFIHSGYAWVDASGTPKQCIPSSPYGAQCTARIMEEGWQMKY